MASERYDFGEIEKKWQKRWLADRTYEPDLDNAKKPFYNLMMFPYPSAEGLHVGNMYAFTGADIYGRKKRMEGYEVFEPIGLDGFGIHSENYALKIGAHPMEQAKVSEARFYEQLAAIGNGFAWKERLETYDPAYYRWTQWIFVQLWKHGLAYRKKQAVNWCPSCKTVLADEQVILRAVKNDPEQMRGIGVCERCGTAVEKKEMEQWFFRITKYADRLLANLEKIDWSERVKIAQRNWIGKSEGAMIKFEIRNSKFEIEVFTTRPDTLFGATYMVLAPEHPLVRELPITNRMEADEYVEAAKRKSEEDRIAETREKTGVELKGVKAVNPANKEEIPIFVADYVLSGYGTGAIMAVPAHDARDFAFAKKFNLPVKMVICSHYPAPTCPVLDEAYEGEGHLVGSGTFDGMKSEEAGWKITEVVGGKRETRFRLRDWLISRQRYWGVPIPMIFCETCAAAGKGEHPPAGGEMPGWYAVPEEQLPVELPYIGDFRPQGLPAGRQGKASSPLASVPEFYETKCPECGGRARRETDVSDTFLDSAWYYIGYLAVTANPESETQNSKFKIQNSPFLNPLNQKWLPVHLYTGGAEHSVLHLLYVRFVALALRDMKLLDFFSETGEPFPKFRAHGLLIKEGAKMSKSKGNVVNPDLYIKKYGADTLRMYLMFLAPFEQGGDFRDASIQGIVRFLERVWKFYIRMDANGDMNGANEISEVSGEVSEHSRSLHRAIKKVTEDVEALQYNTAISALMVLLNEMESNHQSSVMSRESFLKLLAPFAPHLAEELWHRMGREGSIHRAPWPEYDSSLINDDTFPLVVQVNGKHRGTIEVPRGIMKEEAEVQARADTRVGAALAGKVVMKAIYVPDRLINFVVQ